eukprot:scaffold34_cov62-Phaeocystis_antarctica.AAC.4
MNDPTKNWNVHVRGHVKPYLVARTPLCFSPPARAAPPLGPRGCGGRVSRLRRACAAPRGPRGRPCVQ